VPATDRVRRRPFPSDFVSRLTGQTITSVSRRGKYLLATLSSGDYFGEIALIDEGTRSATITAATDVTAYGMTSWEFKPFVEDHPQVAWALLKTLAQRLRVKVPVRDDDQRVPSVTGLFPTANWHERETYDLYGIVFDGHPDLTRILMPADWEGHPLRRDYPLGYEEVEFTFNFDEIEKKKPYAKE